MCGPAPKTPEVNQIVPPLPVQPLKIAQTSNVAAKPVEQDTKKEVSYGAKSKKDKAMKGIKNDGASLLVPISDKGNKAGGINLA